MKKLVQIFDFAKVSNYMVFLKYEENQLLTTKKYFWFKRFKWLGPFGTSERLMFYSVD